MTHAVRSCVAILGAIAPAATLCAQWSDDPATNLPIADGPGEQVLPKIAVAPDDSVYVGWFNNVSGNYDLYLQHLDPDGVELWPHNGIVVSSHPQASSLVDWDMTTDSAGNAVLVFTDTRAGGDRDVYAYKVAPDGTMLWGPDGITLSSNNAFEPDPVVVEASDGAMVFVWPRLPNTGGGVLMMQRVGPGGTKQFPGDGIAVVNTSQAPGFQRVVASDNGSVIVSWVQDIASLFQPRHLWADKFDVSGNSLWGGPQAVFTSTSLPIAHRPRLLSDKAGGALLVWHWADAGSRFHTGVQHINATGQMLFSNLEVAPASPRSQLDPAAWYDAAAGELYVAWRETNILQSNYGVRAQRIDASGTRLWGDAGLELLPVTSDNRLAVRVVGAPAGIMVFLLNAAGGVFAQEVVLGMRVDSTGSFVWSPAVLSVASTPSSKLRLPVATDSRGMAILVWEDERSGTADVYGQNVWPDGTLGPQPCTGDLNGDGTVDLLDLSTLLNNFGTSGAGPADGDLDGDGDVDLIDLSTLLTAFGTSCL